MTDDKREIQKRYDNLIWASCLLNRVINHELDDMRHRDAKQAIGVIYQVVQYLEAEADKIRPQVAD